MLYRLYVTCWKHEFPADWGEHAVRRVDPSSEKELWAKRCENEDQALVELHEEAEKLLDPISGYTRIECEVVNGDGKKLVSYAVRPEPKFDNNATMVSIDGSYMIHRKEDQ